jgi:NADPH2:quinone reductase
VDKRTQVLELGAEASIDGTPEGLKDRILEANGGKPVDIVLEMVGGQTFDESFAALAPFGRIVAYGIATREQNEVRTGKLLLDPNA